MEKQVISPVSGAVMVPQPAPDKRAIVKAMVERGSNAAYAQNFADTVHEKEAAHGVVYVDPASGYVMRVKADAPAAKAERA